MLEGKFSNLISHNPVDVSLPESLSRFEALNILSLFYPHKGAVASRRHNHHVRTGNAGGLKG